MKKIIYIYNRKRAHKILPLLEGLPFIEVKDIRDILRARKITTRNYIVLLDSFGRWGLLGIGATLILNAELIVRLRGEIFKEQRELLICNKGIFRWVRYFSNVLIAKKCLKTAKMIIYNSKYLEKKMSNYNKNKLAVIVYNPYTKIVRSKSENKLPDLNGKLKIASITNFHLMSKTQPIIDAIDWIPINTWNELDIQWIICGSGSNKKALINIIEKYSLEKRIHVLGWIENIEDVLTWCDVFIHLTKLDAFPNVTLEAMMKEKPIITNSNSCGTKEQVFTDLNGIVVNDNKSFVAALKKYANEKGVRKIHGEAGKRVVMEMFSVPLQKKKMHDALAPLL